MITGLLKRSGLLVPVILWLIAAAAAPAYALAPPVNATLEPSQIALGDSAQLTITTSGKGLEIPKLPQVPGLEFRIVGQSQRIQLINGAALASTSLIVRVTPQTAGVFTIPGVAPDSAPLVLRVTPPGSAAPPGKSPGFGTPGTGAGANGSRMSADGAAFVRLVLPKRDIYVGESVPVDIEVGLRDGFARPNALPTLVGSDFTLNNLSHQPEQISRIVDGKPYAVLTWHSVVAAVKPGKFSLTVEAPLTVRIRTRPQRDSIIDDMLGDPFMQNFFGATVTKDITATSLPAELTVLELPVDGRPADFNGAVGSFKIAGDISSTKAAAGDPLTLRMHVSGTGNFDRVDSPMLKQLDHWKTYPPKSSFKATDALGLKGEKIFEQPLIASKPGLQILPGMAFSYFDPSTHRYETVHSAPLDVSVSPSLADGSLHAAPAPADGAASAGTPPAANNGLRPDHLVTDAGTPTLIPPYLQPRFLTIPSLLALSFAGAWVGLRRRSSDASIAAGSRRRGSSKIIKRVLKDLESAARAGDSASFFNAARLALEAARVENDAVLRFLAQADEANYSGLRPTHEDFARWMQFMRETLERNSLRPGPLQSEARDRPKLSNEGPA